MKIMYRIVAVVSVALVLTTGCVNPNGTQNNTGSGALIGGALGAISGAIIGHNHGNTGAGALIGAAAGVIAGGLVGNMIDQQQQQRLQQQSPQTWNKIQNNDVVYQQQQSVPLQPQPFANSNPTYAQPALDFTTDNPGNSMSVIGAQGLKFIGGAPSAPSLSLPSGGQLYVFGATTGGAYPMGAFANGQTIQTQDANGNVSAELSVTANNSNSYTTSTANDALGGFGVSGFNFAQGFYGVNPGPGPNLQASVSFTLSAPALVVVVGMGSSQATLSFSGLDNPTVDVFDQTIDGIHEPVLGIEHKYLKAGTYTIQETTGDGTAYYQTPANEVDLIGVMIFSDQSNAATSANPQIQIDLPSKTMPTPLTIRPTPSPAPDNGSTQTPTPLTVDDIKALAAAGVRPDAINKEIDISQSKFSQSDIAAAQQANVNSEVIAHMQSHPS
jgi:hypothetical protein